ncbi:hypothetical protein ACFQY3_25025 [Paenibacillus farraposensis]|nr:hypothetical protein [Paenibacillus farraposensis]
MWGRAKRSAVRPRASSRAELRLGNAPTAASGATNWPHQTLL